MVQVRCVASQLGTTAQRELAERPKTLNSGLFVLHFLPPPVHGTWVYTKCEATACWAADRMIARLVPAITVLEPRPERLKDCSGVARRAKM